MTDAEFYIQKYRWDVDSQGYVAISEVHDLEKDFGGLLRYKSCVGLLLYGEVYEYSESYAESERSSVFIPHDVVRKPTEVTLSVYAFGSAPELPVASTVSDLELVESAHNAYHDFVRFLSGDFVCYWDTVRKRKMMSRLVSATTVKDDILYGMPYIQADIKLKNVYGCTFPLTDKRFGPTDY